MKRYIWVIAVCTLFLSLPKPAAAAVSCEEFRVTGGNNRFVPSTVTFAARASGPVQTYTYYFGDGQREQSVNSEVSHKYDVSGTFTARVDVDGSSCQTIFSLLTSPLESQKSGCSNVFIQGGNNFPAGTNVKFLITGYDNKSGIKAYKIDFGNGQVKQSNIGNFDLTFPTPGTYTVKGYITDSKNVEKGGEGGCQTPLYITGQPLQTQPATGTPTWFTVIGLLSGICLFFIARKNYTHR